MSRFARCSARRVVMVLALSGLVSACAGDPWVDSRREAGQVDPVGKSTTDRPAICFAPSATTAEEVAAMAQQVCDRTGRRAVYLRTLRWQCRLTTPHRAIFACR